MTVQDIPSINAALNATATVLILAGFVLIKRGHRIAHRAAMLSAGVVSAFFLVGYVAHKILVRGVHSYLGTDNPTIRATYYTMLISHIILAVVIAYLVPKTFAIALKGDYERHKRWARFTFPIWLYVSFTGVLIYLFIYQWWPINPTG